jgi:hypothetical protein
VTAPRTDWSVVFADHPTANDLELAVILGCHPSTVKQHRCALGLPRRYSRPSHVAKAKPVQVWTRCTIDDKAAIDRAARQAGMTVSEWILSTVRWRLENVQERMGAILDRAHEASGLDPTRYASREVPRVGDTVERAGATLQVTAVNPPMSGGYIINASEFHLLRRGGA